MLDKREIENFYNLLWLDTFMTGHRGFIAGGCFKNIFNGEKVKDLDMFFNNKEDWFDATVYFDKLCEDKVFSHYYQNSKVKAYKCLKTDITVELVCSTYGTAEEILNKFDFTITKFAYYKEYIEEELPNGDVLKLFHKPTTETRIENKILCHDRFFEHLHQKRLVVDNELPFPISTFERMIRYAKYGYFPCKETKMKIIDGIRKAPDTNGLSRTLYEGLD